MSDRMAVVVALAAAMGALLERGPSPWIGALLVVAALASRRPAALAMAVFVLAGGLAARAEAGLVPVLPGSFTGSATLLTDPELIAGGLRADVRLGDGRHMQAVARAPAAVEQFRDRAGVSSSSCVGGSDACRPEVTRRCANATARPRARRSARNVAAGSRCRA